MEEGNYNKDVDQRLNDLALKYRAGDHVAGERLLQLLSPRIRILSLKYSRFVNTDMEDFVQEIVLELMAWLQRTDTRVHAGNLHVFIHNQAKRITTVYKRQERVIVSSDATMPATKTHSKDLSYWLQTTIKQLPRRERIIANMWFDGKEAQAIADKIGRNKRTTERLIRSVLHTIYTKALQYHDL